MTNDKNNTTVNPAEIAAIISAIVALIKTIIGLIPKKDRASVKERIVKDCTIDIG